MTGGGKGPAGERDGRSSPPSQWEWLKEPLTQEKVKEIRRRVGIHYLVHPRVKFAIQVTPFAIALLLLFVYLYRAGDLTASTAFAAYTGSATGVMAVVAVLSILGLRGRFTGLIPPGDPGHYYLPYVPKDMPPGMKRDQVRLSAISIPGTYRSPSDAAHRGPFQWYFPTGQTEKLRSLEFKFAPILVHANGRDAKEARAHARVRLNSGVEASFPLGTWVGAGQLNWFVGDWEERLHSDEQAPDGSLSEPILNYVFEHPGDGLNKYLRKPETTILREQAEYLPLFYMRGDSPNVYLCGQVRAEIVARCEGDAPVDFDMELMVSALDFRRSPPLKLHCTAKWDVLTVEEGRW